MKKLWLGLLLLINLNLPAQVKINLDIIARIESNYDTLAINRTDGGSRGLYQIHPVCLKDYNKLNKTSYTLDDLFKKDINTRIATWMFEERIPQLLKAYHYKYTLNNVLICYNAGITFLTKKKKIPLTTVNYIRKYKKYAK